MKVQVINHRKGTVEVIDSSEETQPFIYKDRYYKPIRANKSIYKQDGNKKDAPP